jgi:5'(3')-deoxyribonucleotidase
MRPTICVDLDATLADYSQGWLGIEHIGDPIPGAVEFVRALSKFADVVIHTARVRDDEQAAKDRVAEWLKSHKFPYYSIHVGRGKPIACAYVDDRAVHCAPQASIDGPEGVYDDALEQCKQLAALHK